MLTAKQVDGLKPKDKNYKVTDADGLYILITPTGIKSWRYNYKSTEGYKTKIYGRYPSLSLSAARLENAKFKDELNNGKDHKEMLFSDLFNEWYPKKCKSINSKEHQVKIFNRVRDHIMPKIGNLPLSQLKRVKLVEVVKGVVNHKGELLNETAHRVGNSICEILDYAVDCGYLEGHFATKLGRVLTPIKHRKMNCIAIDEAPALFKAIQTYEENVVRLGLMLMAHIFLRTDELRHLKKSYRKGNMLVVPAELMKMDKPHVVPLSKQTIEILDQLDIYSGDSDYYLNSPDRSNVPISENTLLFALYRLGYRGKMTGHGFRALASTVMNGQSSYKGDVIERQLAHKETDEVRDAYNRAEYLDERIGLMQWYSDWITQQFSSADHQQ